MEFGFYGARLKPKVAKTVPVHAQCGLSNVKRVAATFYVLGLAYIFFSQSVVRFRYFFTFKGEGRRSPQLRSCL